MTISNRTSKSAAKSKRSAKGLVTRGKTVRRRADKSPVDNNMEDSKSEQAIQDMLNFLGTDTILEAYLDHHRPDEKVQIIMENTGRRGNAKLYNYDYALRFDGVHWKSIDKIDGKSPKKSAKRDETTHVIYDSYKMDLQRQGTNNFCQSYATMLLAHKGNINKLGFKKGEYTENAQKVAEEWLKFLNIGVIKNWIRGDREPIFRKFDSVLKTLKAVTEDRAFATEVANSKE